LAQKMSADVLCLRPEADFQRANALPPRSLEVVYRALGDPDIPTLMKQARALVIPAVGAKLPQDLFQTTTVKFVQVTGAGLDRLDLEKLKQLGIAVANVPGGSNTAIAEYVVTTASVLLRRFAWADREIRVGHYREFRARMLADNLPGLEGLAVGIVGLGVIGMAVAEAFQGHGCSILYYDPAPRDSEAAEKWGFRPAGSLDELFREADVVSLHLPLLASTSGLIGARELANMKPGAVLIQASRGGILDEVALAEILENGKIAGAAVDVYTEEPPPPNHPLLTLPGEAANRLLLTPHIAGVTRQSTTYLSRKAWENVHRVLVDKQPPLNSAF
jgi:phosphoglycerate dehydrogenase-like enzyme